MILNNAFKPVAAVVAAAVVMTGSMFAVGAAGAQEIAPMTAAQTQQLPDFVQLVEKYGKGVVGVKEVPGMAITKYCSLKTEPLEGNCYNCTDMIEKPKPEQIMGNFSILGRVVLPPQIFDILENTPLGTGNELQLTDAMKTLAQTQGVVAVDYEGVRYDMGNKFGILQANIEVGLKHPETKDELKAYIKKIAAELD